MIRKKDIEYLGLLEMEMCNTSAAGHEMLIGYFASIEPFSQFKLNIASHMLVFKHINLCDHQV